MDSNCSLFHTPAKTLIAFLHDLAVMIGVRLARCVSISYIFA